MALDVYVGPLTRYYSGGWRNVAERPARERDAGKHAGRPGSSNTAGDVERTRSGVLSWRRGLAASLGDSLAEPLDWNEGAEAPHFTARPGWDGLGSLVLWAAYAEHPALRHPVILPEAWEDDPALARSCAEGFRSRYSHLVRKVELWLPVPFRFTFEGEDVDGRRIVVGSAMTLERQLGELNTGTWKMRGDETASWRRSVPAGEAMLEAKARYAFAVMSGLARRAVEHRLPMKLDF